MKFGGAMKLAGRGVLLDIEGTTSSVAFVFDVMFPFAQRELRRYVAEHWGDSTLRDVCEQFAHDAEAPSFAEWTKGAEPQAALVAEAERLMAADVKATGLKQLQGLIWEAGFHRGELTAHVYADVPPALAAWRQAGLDLRIYSSGSVHAQRLFFGHTIAGDLTPYFTGHYDTTTGPKREAASYLRIASDWGLPPHEILFLSDIAAELDAARAASLQTALVVRDSPAHGDEQHPTLTSFEELTCSLPREQFS
jgi:enolase-phosphatase E1